jgi:hypothetical protein
LEVITMKRVIFTSSVVVLIMALTLCGQPAGGGGGMGGNRGGGMAAAASTRRPDKAARLASIAEIEKQIATLRAAIQKAPATDPCIPQLQDEALSTFTTQYTEESNAVNQIAQTINTLRVTAAAGGRGGRGGGGGGLTAEVLTELTKLAQGENATKLAARLEALAKEAAAAPARGGGGGGGSALDAALTLTRPTSSPGLGQKLAALSAPDTDGFISMFNGKDLTGWDALPNWWSVKDGAIDVVETSAENIQSDLIWIDSVDNPAKYANFELRVSVRWITHTGNSGIQFRGVIDNAETKHVGGYQPDIDAANQYSGSLYDERNANGTHRSPVSGPHMGPRGYKITYPADGGAATSEPLAENPQTLTALVKPVGEWNDYVIIANGSRITVSVNGHLFSDVTDLYPTARKDGVIAFQQHAGQQMQLQFKDVKIKFLPAK